MQRAKEDSPVTELFSQLAQETSELVRQEVALAKTELSEKVASAGKDVGFIVGGALFAYAGLFVLLGALVVGLAGFMPMWLSALIVGVVVVGIGFVLVQQGISALTKQDWTPRQTIASLKETAEWAKEVTS